MSHAQAPTRKQSTNNEIVLGRHGHAYPTLPYCNLQPFHIATRKQSVLLANTGKSSLHPRRAYPNQPHLPDEQRTDGDEEQAPPSLIRTEAATDTGALVGATVGTDAEAFKTSTDRMSGMRAALTRGDQWATRQKIQCIKEAKENGCVKLVFGTLPARPKAPLTGKAMQGSITQCLRK